MEDKIEVGEYIKFKDNSIDRIKEIINTHGNRKLIAFEKRNSYLSDLGLKKQIVKHSKNIIDLVEEGDYVNGYKVLEIRKHFEVQPYRISIMVYKTKDAEFWKSIEEQDIEDIVTHEQFDSVKYKVGE